MLFRNLGTKIKNECLTKQINAERVLRGIKKTMIAGCSIVGASVIINATSSTMAKALVTSILTMNFVIIGFVIVGSVITIKYAAEESAKLIYKALTA